MARAPGLSAPTLSPFGGSGAGFGAFSIVDPGREAYITFLKVENAWQSGKASDDAYLAAMRVYAAALPEGSSTRLNTDQRIVETTYRVQRNVLVSKVDAGTADLEDLLDFDQAALRGLTVDSETYRDRLALVQRTQQEIFSEAEDVIVERYQKGTVTTTQLQAWYRDQKGAYSSNPELAESIGDRIDELHLRVLDERDSKAIGDYNDGKLTDDEFLVYAAAARARYTSGTSQAREWDERIDTARESRQETGLLYRYGLSQQYAELQRFVKSNAGGAGGRTSTSTQKRIVLGADGKWHTVTSTSTKAIKPTALQQEAHRKLQIEIASAKRQMQQIVGKLGATPDDGSWVSTDRMIGFYQQRQGKLARGSGDWYAMQEKIDSLQERKHAEAVLSKQGIRITYPGVSSGGSGGGGGGGGRGAGARAGSGGGGGTGTKDASADIGIDQFMAALARVESGGRYDARNSSSGAYGKYQIMPANWPSWAQHYLGNANAAQTPENQEKVARGRIMDYYKNQGDWSRVAYSWLNGPGKVPRGSWTSDSVRYVRNVMAGVGLSLPRMQPGEGTTTPGRGYAPSPRGGGGGGGTAPAADRQGGTTRQQGKVGGLTELVNVLAPARRTGTQRLDLRAAGFPVNLDGQAFSSFYTAYERAFNAGQESFVDSSSGRPIAYFIGDDPEERISRMRELDDLRVGYYKERARAYAGTATEITAHNQYNEAVRDMAAHEYRILDTVNPVKGGRDTAKVNPLAAGNRLLDKTVEAIKVSIAAANAAYSRGDFQAAYAHLQTASHYMDTRIATTGPLKGQALGATVSLAELLYASEEKIARLQAKFGGLSPEEALGQEGGGAFAKDLERLRGFQTEVAEALAEGNDLEADLKSQLKVDERGNVVLDRNDEVQLAEGWARFITPDGKVKIDRLEVSGVDPKTGQPRRAPEGHVKVLTKSGSSVVDAYAKWVIGSVGWIRGADGVNRELLGKIVTVVDPTTGRDNTLYEDPLNPGHWSSSPVVFNQPQGFRAVGVGANTTYQFSGPGSDGMVYSLQFDTKTGTYIVVGNRPAGAFGLQAEIVDQPVGGAGDANVLALLAESGFTRDTSTSGGFLDVTTPVFGLTPNEYRDFLNGPTPLAGMRNQPRVNTRADLRIGSAADRDPHVASQLPRLPSQPRVNNRAELRVGSAADRDPNVASKLPPLLQQPRSGGPSIEERDERAKLPPIRLPQIGGVGSAADRSVTAARNLPRLTTSHPASTPKPSPQLTARQLRRRRRLNRAEPPRTPAPAPRPAPAPLPPVRPPRSGAQEF